MSYHQRRVPSGDQQVLVAVAVDVCAGTGGELPSVVELRDDGAGQPERARWLGRDIEHLDALPTFGDRSSIVDQLVVSVAVDVGGEPVGVRLEVDAGPAVEPAVGAHVARAGAVGVPEPDALGIDAVITSVHDVGVAVAVRSANEGLLVSETNPAPSDSQVSIVRSVVPNEHAYPE